MLGRMVRDDLRGMCLLTKVLVGSCGNLFLTERSCIFMFLRTLEECFAPGDRPKYRAKSVVQMAGAKHVRRKIPFVFDHELQELTSGSFFTVRGLAELFL